MCVCVRVRVRVRECSKIQIFPPAIKALTSSPDLGHSRSVVPSSPHRSAEVAQLPPLL